MTRAGALAGMILLMAGTAPAQETGGLRMVFGVESSLRSDDNFELDPDADGHTTLWDTRLSFGLVSETRTARLALDLGTTARLAEFPDSSESGFEAPSARLSYTRESARSRISVDANWEKADIRFLSPFSDPVLILDEETGEPFLVSDPGNRERADLGLRLETGLDTPLGLVLTARHNALRYSDTVDPDYYDRESNSLSARLRLRFSPVTTGYVTASQRLFSAEDTPDTDRETRRLGIGLDHAIDAATVFEAEIDTVRIETEKTTGGVRRTDVDEGLDASLSLSRELSNGRARLSYTHDTTTTGSRDTLRLGRSLELPRGGLSVSVGATEGEAGETALVGEVGYTHELPRGGLRLGLSRAVSTSDDDEDVLRTRLNAGWEHEIGALSSLSLDMGYAQIEDGGTGDTTERERANLRLAYNRLLAQDWRLSAGVEHRLDREEGNPDAHSNAVFVTIRRNFSIRP
ncbi:hypothetical protein Ga0609869_003596 [Rhodovulum iodosum]|uniref:TIGR03016 family PEP-CTERM system-associated outer membrane protein n=1 Tax=Rhodovulum iodosum TaxID=68291 RepID=A0ABV3Y106_9RHOB|nr:hypothetical protein [Rhodovulum robiginosum]RSK38862.1 hypothetical protein EJA01_01560 [Rhodovulum robiginosum]